MRENTDQKLLCVWTLFTQWKCNINPFHVAVPFLYSLKTSKNIERYNDVFRGYRKGPVTWNKLITMFILTVFSVYGYPFVAHHSHLRPTCNRGSFCPLAPQLFVKDGNFYCYYALNFLIYILNTLQYWVASILVIISYCQTFSSLNASWFYEIGVLDSTKRKVKIERWMNKNKSSSKQRN